MKLTAAEKKERAEIIKRIRDAEGKVNDAVTELNDAIVEKYGEVDSLMGELNDAVQAANDFLGEHSDDGDEIEVNDPSEPDQCDELDIDLEWLEN